MRQNRMTSLAPSWLMRAGFLFGVRMSVTDDAIENLATAFCLLSAPEHKALFLESLQSIARIAKAELIFQMQLDYTQATTGIVTQH